MIEIPISDWETPLRCLKENQVPPDLALRVLRFASETGAWEGGQVRRRLINLRPNHDPKMLRLWMPPKHPLRIPQPVRCTSPGASAERALRSRGERLRQLELQFGDELRGRSTRDIVGELSLPDPVRERLLRYPSWDVVRDDAVRLAVLQTVAQHLAIHPN